ncbi:type II secretion system F family protein [Polynucleobacter sp. MWH-Creno-3A4]|uniref:type II secretion system F family protein n=1 Tax=Polynucleobacter sp. MWH-Creno-3A4 TaxID=1855886 RepID=UPI001C0B98B9|nr:type II secretion system F family protein [Polynucleobacter sp. MWH-Creno-3A4]MBU3606005.1 type II secretion system F family protein [Polynucleobacter sp. MWH-Creno-3A4]
MAINKSDQLAFAQQLLSLLGAGLPLLNAMELIHTTAPKHWQNGIGNLCTQLKRGESLSQSLLSQKNQFSIEFINLIRVSERTGNIELALQTICQQLESQIELRHKIQQSLSYPLITLASSFLLILVMMIWVVPVFKDVFTHFQAELPAPTKVLIQISTLVQHYFLEITVLLVFTGTVFAISWLRSSRLQKKCDALCFSIPILGRLFRLATLTYWCRTLGHLLESGLPLPDALRVTAQSSNHWLSHDLSAEVFKHLTRGWPLGDALIRADPKHQLFDLETLQLLRIASESGSLPQMLCKRANTLGTQLSNKLNTLSQSLEPLLIIFVGIVIGSLVIILYLPIFNLGQIV